MERLERRLRLWRTTYFFQRRRFVQVLTTLLCCVGTGDVASGELWTRKGPEGGKVQALAIDPANPAILYAGTAGGLFKSIDGGNNWTPINNGLTETDVGSLAIDPKTPAIVYASTGAGVFKSIDGGAMWTITGLACGCLLAIDPRTPSTLFATDGRALYKSVDGGANWASLDIPVPFDFWSVISALAIDPVIPTNVYVAVTGFGCCSGVYKSTDGGVTWRFSLGEPTRALAIDPVTPTTVYAGAGFALFGGEVLGDGVFKSTDGGASWSRANIGLVGSDINVIAVDPKTPATVYVGTLFDGVFKTTTGGASWIRSNTGLKAAPVNSLAVAATSPDHLYVGVYSERGTAVLRSTDGADTWTATGLALVDVLGVAELAVDPSNPKTIYMGGLTGVFKSIDGGDTWTLNNLGTNAVTIAIDPKVTTTLYVGTGGGVYKSTDGAATWRFSSVPGSYVSALAIDPKTPATVYAGTVAHQGGRLFKSTDGGESWNQISGQFGFDSNVFAIAIDPVTPTTLYVGTSLTGVFKSTNGGEFLPPANSGLTTTDVRALIIDQITPTTVYAGTNAGVFKSIDGAGSWAAINTGLTATDIRRLSISPTNPTVVYAGTNGGVFKMIGPTAPTIAVNFNGQLRDRVGQGEFARNPDGQLDGVFTVTLNTGSGDRTVTRLDLVRNNGDGIWNTNPGDGFWILGAATNDTAQLYNGVNDTVHFPMSEGGSFKIFAADLQNRMFTSGSAFVLTASFADGTTAAARVIIPSANVAPTLAYNGPLRDRVRQENNSQAADGHLDPTFTVTFVTGGSARTVTSLRLDSSNGGVWDTDSASGFWTLGAATNFDAPLYNGSNDTVTFAVSSGGSFVVFASDWFFGPPFPKGLFQPGTTFTLAIGFADGSTATATTTIPGNNDTITLSYNGPLQDRVADDNHAVRTDGFLDPTFTVTFPAGGITRTVTSLRLDSSDGGVWDTSSATGFWTLAAATNLQTASYNAADDSVNFAVPAGGTFMIFASDWFRGAPFPNGLFQKGKGLTLTVGFSDGITTAASTVIP